MKPHSITILVKESNVNFHNWYTTAEGFHHPILKKIVGVVIPNWIMKIENDYGEWGVIESEWQKAGEFFSRRMEAKKIDIFDVEKKHYEVGKKIWQLTNFAYTEDLENISTSRLLAVLKQMWKHYHYLSGIGYVAVISDFEHGFLTGQLSKILLKKNIPAKKIQIYQSLLASPNKKTLFWQEQFDLIKLCVKHSNIKKLANSRALDKHVKKYFWLNYGYQGPVWTKNDFLKRASDICKSKSIKKTLAAHERYFKILISEQKKFKNKLKITPAEDYFFETARLFTYLKGYRIETRHRYSYALDKIFIELGKRRGLPLNFFRYALKEEIVNAMTKKFFTYQDILKRRKKMLFILNKLNGQFVKFEKVDGALRDLLVKEKIEFKSNITGQTAYSGKVKGRVKILISVKDVAKVKKGDILVTFATTPDFLPAMILAAAFVTDQGGITSHAAITARELKKPCIIGTKIATKVFKDGDLVEVDADKGVVKKISK